MAKDKMPNLELIKSCRCLKQHHNLEGKKQSDIIDSELGPTLSSLKDSPGSSPQSVRIVSDWGLKVRLHFDRSDYASRDYRDLEPEAALKLLEWLEKYKDFIIAMKE